MSESHQFVAGGRYTVIPRTLVFLRHGDDVLLLKGAPTKRLWANRYNGLGGHVEAAETIEAAALREVWEEAGIPADRIEGLALRGLVNAAGAGTAAGEPGVLLCIFVGWALTREVVASAEGELAWVPVRDLAKMDLVDEDRFLPRLLEADRLLFGRMRYDGAGRVVAFTLG